MESCAYAEVIVDIAHSNIDRIFDYKIEDGRDIPPGSPGARAVWTSIYRGDRVAVQTGDRSLAGKNTPAWQMPGRAPGRDPRTDPPGTIHLRQIPDDDGFCSAADVPC